MTDDPKPTEPCDACRDVVEIENELLPYTIRPCLRCGRKMKVREAGKHGIGLVIQEGDQPVLPKDFLQFSANPLKGSGHFSRTGLTWFAEVIFAEDISARRDDFRAFVEERVERLVDRIGGFETVKHLKLENDNDLTKMFEMLSQDRYSVEWHCLMALSFLANARNFMLANETDHAVWSASAAERYLALIAFRDHFEEAVWMGQSARRLVELLNLWKAHENNGDEEFWHIKFSEAPFVFSQLFSVPITFLKGKAYVGGRQIDGKSSRLVDFLFSGKASQDAVLIEIKTPVVDLLNKTKYRSNVYTPTSDLTGAVMQVMDYRRTLIQDFRSITADHDIELNAFEPKAIVIAGNFRQLADEEQRRSFELYRTGLANVEIVTFDEVFQKLESLASLFSLVRSDAG